MDNQTLKKLNDEDYPDKGIVDNQRDKQVNKVISKVDLNKVSHQMVMSGFVAMVEDDGMTLHEAMETVREIQRISAPAIMQIMGERRAASGQG